MSEMIERIAKAKWAHRQEVARAAGIQPPLDDWDDELESLREEVRAEARVTIMAMREPTAEMKAVEGVHWDYSCHVCGGLKDGWQAMINAALRTP